MASSHGTQPFKPPLNTGTSASSSTNHIVRSLAVCSTDKTENVEAHPLKGKGSDPTLFEASQPPPNSLHTLTDRLTQLEEKKENALTAVGEERKSKR